MTIGDLALMVGKAFNAMDEKIKKRFDTIENKVEKLILDTEQNFQRVRKDILIMADKFPSIYQFDELSNRVAKLEAKAQKIKKIKA